MLFTTGKYWVFFAIVFFLYWLLSSRRRLSVLFLLISSYYFYALWNPKFLILLFAISTVDFLTAKVISSTLSTRLRKLLLFSSVVTDVGSLVAFKYFDFFSTSLFELLEQTGWNASAFLINAVVPLGLSFIAFRSLSYVIDVYRKTAEATTNYIEYLTFVAFFPTLLAGPVVRASELLPQLRTKRVLRNEDGMRALLLIVLGLIKKIVVADFLANNLVNRVFDQPELYSSVETLAAIYGYALQIYCDFSGYTDIAIGCALLLGFNLPENFNAPYRATNLREFWKRWHISLSRWLFDYVFLSLGGLRKRRNLYRNLMLTFLIGGLWHGAGWTFIVWGALHGVGLSITHWWELRRKRLGVKPSHHWLITAACVFATFHFVCLTWIVFRAESLSQALQVLDRLTAFEFSAGNLPWSLTLLLLLAYASHWISKRGVKLIEDSWAWLPSPVQAALILALAVGLYHIAGAEVQFIYGNF